VNVKRRHFIPFTRHDLVKICLDNSAELNAPLTRLADLLKKTFHNEFSVTLEQLTLGYAKVDPDVDTQSLSDTDLDTGMEGFEALLENILQKGNFVKLSQADLESALQEASLFKIRLYVDFDDFEDVIVYCRGESVKHETLSQWFGLRKRELSFINYDRVVLYLRFKDQESSENNTVSLLHPKKTLLKLFRNVPKADLEMLFPNTRIGMRFWDKLLIGVPAIISGGVVFTTKLGATIVVLTGVIGFWLGFRQKPVALDATAFLALAAGMGALGGYLWKQFSNFKNRKLKFSQALTENLYFKSLDNNAGVLYRLLAEAEEEEFKEAWLAWFFLFQAKDALSERELDERIEQWFARQWHADVDFEVDDALAKLERLGLAENKKGFWQVVTVEQAVSHLERALVASI